MPKIFYNERNYLIPPCVKGIRSKTEDKFSLAHGEYRHTNNKTKKQ